MGNVLSVLLLDSDLTACSEIVQMAETRKNLCVSGLSPHIREATARVRSSRQGQLILDLELAAETAGAPPISARLYRSVYAALDTVGVSPKAVGYAYLAEAILLIYQSPTPRFCAVLGQRHGKTEASVERAMQNALNRAWHVTDPDILHECYTARVRSRNGAPTLTDFVYFYANKLRMEG